MSKRIDTRALIDTSAAQTGLAYTSTEFTEPLARFAESVDTEGNLGEAGIDWFRQDLTRLLTNRLLLDALTGAHPEILDEDVSDPIVITGLPRTGTTKLQKVLATGDTYQWLPLYRALFPAPLAPPRTDPDPRVVITDEQSQLMAQVFPDLMAGHPMSTHEPEEEVLLLQLSFRVPTNGWFYRAPSYVAWVEHQDQIPAYTDLCRAMQVLQWQDCGRRNRPWVLKSPAHLGGLRLLFATFPRATVVHCHRDIPEALPSLARLLELIQLSRGAEYIDNHELGAFLTDYCSELWRRNLTDRTGLDPTRILDVRYDTIRDDVASVLDAIHTSRGVTLDPAVREHMLTWQDSNPQHRHGRHVYSLGRYGMTPERLRDTFADYDRAQLV